MKLILQGAANMSKGVMENEYLTLPPSKMAMSCMKHDIAILVPFQIATAILLQRYYDLFT